MQHNFEGLDRPGGVARVGLLRPLRSRDFRLLWAGMTVSLVGDGVFLVAIAWTAYSLWNTPAALSIVGIAMTVPMIACLLFGGVISDRFDRRRVLLYADLGRGLVVALLAALALADALNFAGLVVIVAAYGVGAAFFTPAFESIVPTIVHPDDLAQANALDQFVRPIAMRLVGPALGGLLISVVGVGSAFALDAASFLVSGDHRPGTAPSRRRSPGDRLDDRSGDRRPPLRAPQRLAVGNTPVGGGLVSRFPGADRGAPPVRRQEHLHGSATDLGLVLRSGRHRRRRRSGLHGRSAASRGGT